MANPIAAIIAAKAKPSAGPAPEVTEGADSDEGKSTAAQEILEAIQGNDAQALATALSAFLDMHSV